jgi:hypothetical protein
LMKVELRRPVNRRVRNAATKSDSFVRLSE